MGWVLGSLYFGIALCFPPYDKATTLLKAVVSYVLGFAVVFILEFITKGQ